MARSGWIAIVSALCLGASVADGNATPRDDLVAALRARLPASGAIHLTYVPGHGLGEIIVGWHASGDAWYRVTADGVVVRVGPNEFYAGDPYASPGVQRKDVAPPAEEDRLDELTPLPFFMDLIRRPDRYEVESRPQGGWVVTRRCPQAIRTMTAEQVPAEYAASFPEGIWRMEISQDGVPLTLHRSSPNWKGRDRHITFKWSGRVPRPWLVAEDVGEGGWLLASFEIEDDAPSIRFTPDHATLLARESRTRLEAAADRQMADWRGGVDSSASPFWRRASYATIVVGAAMIAVGVLVWLRRRVGS